MVRKKEITEELVGPVHHNEVNEAYYVQHWHSRGVHDEVIDSRNYLSVSAFYIKLQAFILIFIVFLVELSGSPFVHSELSVNPSEKSKEDLLEESTEMDRHYINGHCKH